MKKAKFRHHKYVEKAPCLTGVIMSIVSFFIVQIIMVIINLVIHLFYESYDYQTGIVGLVIGVVVVMLIYKGWFSPEFQGMIKGNLVIGFLIGLGMMAYLAVDYIPNIIIAGMPKIRPLTTTIISTSLVAGLSEELSFRGVLVSTIMREWKDFEKFKMAALISGIVFGLVHATNILSGADPVMTAYQVALACCAGIFLAAVYLRSGSIVPCMFYHALYDLIVLLLSSGTTESGVITSGTLDWTSLYTLVLSIALAGFGFWLLRKSKNADMKEIWNRKWQKLPILDNNK